MWSWCYSVWVWHSTSRHSFHPICSRMAKVNHHLVRVLRRIPENLTNDNCLLPSIFLNKESQFLGVVVVLVVLCLGLAFFVSLQKNQSQPSFDQKSEYFQGFLKFDSEIRIIVYSLQFLFTEKVSFLARGCSFGLKFEHLPFETIEKKWSRMFQHCVWGNLFLAYWNFVSLSFWLVYPYHLCCCIWCFRL